MAPQGYPYEIALDLGLSEPGVLIDHPGQRYVRYSSRSELIVCHSLHCEILGEAALLLRDVMKHCTSIRNATVLSTMATGISRRPRSTIPQVARPTPLLQTCVSDYQAESLFSFYWADWFPVRDGNTRILS